MLNERQFYTWGEFWRGAQLPGFGMSYVFAKLPDYDNETDQWNTLNRHYSPMGRWMSPDPGGVNSTRPDDPQTWNMYAYVRNNPTTLNDPSGLCAEDFCLVEGLVYLGVATTAYLVSPAGQKAMTSLVNLVTQTPGLVATELKTLGNLAKGATNTPAPTPGGSSNQPSVPTKAPDFVGDAGGNVVKIPPGSTARPADNGNGTVYQPPVAPGDHPDANAVRVMGPTGAQPTGSITVHGPTGQPINPETGNPGTRAETHTPIVPSAPAPPQPKFCPSGTTCGP